MNVSCPECATVYRVDPSRIPGDGIQTRCRECDTPFRVDAGEGTDPGEVVRGSPIRAPTGSAGGRHGPGGIRRTEGRVAGNGGTESPGESAAAKAGPDPTRAAGGARPVFGPQDPQTRARRLARALVSDIKVYNPDKWRASLDAGTLRSDFRHEILKSWEEYVEQVGEPLAKRSPYFRDALNDILARGQRIF